MMRPSFAIYFLAPFLLTLWIYALLASHSHSFQLNYYSKLGQAFLAGQLHLLDPPSAELLALENPYDPPGRRILHRPHEKDFEKRMGFLWDSSFHDGKYYLYFGPGPALLTWIPFYLLTQQALSDQWMVYWHAIIGTGCLLWLLFQVRCYYPSAPNSAWWMAAGCVIFGSAMPLLLKRPMFYEVSISGAYAYNAAGLVALWHAYRPGSKHRALCQCLASVLFGCAMSCRVPHGLNILFPASCLLLHRRNSWQHIAGHAARLLGPWSVILLLLASYNYARFGNPFETGASYQLGLFDFHLGAHLLTDAPHAFRHALDYLLTSYRMEYLLPWKPQFGRLASEEVYGLAVYAPFIIWIYAPVIRPIRPTRTPNPTGDLLRALTHIICLYGALHLMHLSIYNWTKGRYLIDFAPWLIFASALYFLQTLHHAEVGQRRRLLMLGALTSIWTLYSSLAAFSALR